MNIKTFKKHLNSKDLCNPADKYLMQCIAKSPGVNRADFDTNDERTLTGRSVKIAQDKYKAGEIAKPKIEKHHIYPKFLFPMPNQKGHMNKTTLLNVDQYTHLMLHAVFNTGQFDLYERIVRYEVDGQYVPGEHIGDIIRNRVNQIIW